MADSHGDISHLVVVGASAGGIESLALLVGSLPSTFTAPIVVGQHLSPRRESALAEILARQSPLPVRVVEDREPLEPGVIYVIPPNHDVKIVGSEVHAREDGAGPHPSIDLLFSSAAEAYGENVIAVVLSGTGSDGAAGARDIKYAGGTVIIQNPETAAYPGMPLSLAPSIVDMVADQDRIGEVLEMLVNGEFETPPMTEQTHLLSFLDQIRDHTGIDFSSYKKPTIQRRLKRRMVATGQPDIPEYIRYVRIDPAERQRLVSSFLIKVTEFYRDPDLFAHLAEHVLPELVAEAEARGAELRIWSAGCATGEEAYSLAMTIADLLGDDQAAPPVRIFATDLDEDAIAFARRGIYPARTVRNLPEDLAARHFVQRGDDYEVGKHLRAMLVFGAHDLGQRAPFPRIDLILCRNVLIYFTPALQRRALQLFAFALRADGYLVLGKSETVNVLAEFFAIDQPRLKSYRRVGDRVLIPSSRVGDVMAPLPVPRPVALRRNARHANPAREDSRPSVSVGVIAQALLGLPFGVILIDRSYDIHYINSEARRVFGIHTTALDQDFIHLVHHFDAVAVRGLIDRSASVAEPAEPAAEVFVSLDTPADARRSIEITSTPYRLGDGQDERLFVLSAIDVTEREQIRRQQGIADADVQRLVTANEEVLKANQELANTIVRLRVRSDDLQVSVEEIQAATEEVETLNEELQASNEELETLNEELQATVEELNTTNDDGQAQSTELRAAAAEAEATRQQLRAIIDGMTDPLIVVAVDGSTILENAAYVALLAKHEGATMVDTSHRPIPDHAAPIRRAALGEQFSMRFAFAQMDHETWFIASGTPGLTDNGEIIVTFREANGG